MEKKVIGIFILIICKFLHKDIEMKLINGQF